jgi:metal-dependent hydrolase (beta-lactamase superfamily II)
MKNKEKPLPRISIIIKVAMVLVCLSMTWPAGNTSENPIEVTYIANEGVLITTSSHKVLIDALFDKPNPNYRAPSENMLEKMQLGRAPFDEVNLVLVTHNHPDHFSPSFAARFMENNPDVLFIAAKDAVTAMKDNIKDWGHVQDTPQRRLRNSSQSYVSDQNGKISLQRYIPVCEARRKKDLPLKSGFIRF